MLSTRFLTAVILSLIVLPCSLPRAFAGDETASVSGTITLDGAPLAGGRIIFHQDNDQFVGAKIKDGKYKLDRVPVGTHRVSVESKGLPARYSSEEQSALRIDIDKGKNVADFDLRSK